MKVESETGQSTTPPENQFGFRTRLLWLMVTMLVVVALDQYSKVYAVREWKGSPPQSYWGDTFRIQYAENPGAFLSLFANLPDEARFWILTVSNAALLIGVTAFLLRSNKVDRWTFFALVLVVSGGVGNLIDRALYGYVIDYFNIGWGSVRSGVFNVADMAISAGFLMMLPLLLKGESKSPSAPEGTRSVVDVKQELVR